MRTPTLTKIPSWLPVFPGFYLTSWDPDREVENYLTNEGLWDRWKNKWYKHWNQAAYMAEVARQCTEAIGWFLPNECGIESVELEEVRSPREYNFENDAINVVYQVDVEQFGMWFRKLIEENPAEWEEYLTRYRSRDGFASFYSPDPEFWSEWTENYTNLLPPKLSHFKTPGHILGTLLQFWFELDGRDWVEKLYYSTDIDVREFLTLPETHE